MPVFINDVFAGEILKVMAAASDPRRDGFMIVAEIGQELRPPQGPDGSWRPALGMLVDAGYVERKHGSGLMGATLYRITETGQYYAKLLRKP